MLAWYQKNRKHMAFFYGVIYMVSCYLMLLSYIPTEITVAGDAADWTVDAPVTIEASHQKQVLATDKASDAKGTMQTYQCKLFGVIPIASIQATKAEEQSVTAVGQPVGIYLKMKHVYVVGIKELTDQEGNTVNPCNYILQEGDYIVAVDGSEITSKEQLQRKIEQCSGASLVLTVQRNEQTMDVQVQPVQTTDGFYKLGVWVKDDIAGVGTLTYMKEDGTYGALGHGISDSSTGDLLRMGHGCLYETDIMGVTPSSIGSPGEITGLISYGNSTRLGDVKRNTSVGIFGELNSVAMASFQGQEYPIAYKQEIQRDSATILFGEEGQVASYQIMIDQIDYDPKEANKSFVFHVTEKSLIDQMGGIVQGMSGSPIIQNGKLIGAVTHVFVNDPTKGYGIFIESMLEP